MVPSACARFLGPYPFSSGEECYLNPDFDVTCYNQSSPTQTLLFGGNTSTVVLSNMSTSNGEVEIMFNLARDSYNSFGRVSRNRQYLSSGNFQISAKNKFVVIGYDTYVHLRITNGNDSHSTECISTCDRKSPFTNGSCTGVGCCEVAVPEGLKAFDKSRRIVGSFNNH
ncbi:hypothetical protein HanRHA438_Chr16g0773871 [Helianthus annuus]|nr:hypothetical protein HanRHA438_Chr16g0773871 [Helianthus annuus]